MNTSLSRIPQFNNKPIRHILHEGKVYWSIVDIIESIYGDGKGKYNWSKIKKNEFDQLLPFWQRFTMVAQDGKMRETDCATEECIYRILQSVPSPKVEDFKLWLAKVAKERLDEERNPELAVNRIVRVYKNRGMTDEWIQKRFKTIIARNNLTDTLKEHGIKAYEYAKTTNILYKHSVGMDADEYKEYKGLEKKDKLRDHFSIEELDLSDMTERFLKAQIKKNDSQGFDEIKEDAKFAGDYGSRIREIMEEALGKSIITKKQDLLD